MTRYGPQQGAAVGDNPAKRGRASHYPLVAFVADTRMVANCWLGPGNTGSANNVIGFSANTLHRLAGKQVSLLRADSRFSDSAFLDNLQQQTMHYVIALRQNQPLQRARVDAQGRRVLHDNNGKPVEGIELTRFLYQATTWSKPPWVIGIRQQLLQRSAPKGKTLNLFADDSVIGQWRFSALVTDLDSNAVQHTLQTLRYKLFVKVGYISTESRKPIIHFAVAMQHRAWMEGLWGASKIVDLPAKFASIYSP